MPETHRVKILIIGAGPAGYTAAIYTARAGLAPMVVAGMQPGGQLTITTDVENYPGFASAVQGPWLMDQMREQAEHCGARLVHDLITAVDFSQQPFRATCDSGDQILADAVIVATGARARWLAAPGEADLRGKGVSACATCDGFFFRNKRVAVIGGGNTAAEEALYLSKLAASVTLIHRRSSLRAERVLQERLLATPNISVLWETVVERFVSGADGTLGGLDLRGPSGAQHLPFDGAFIAIGHEPATAIFRGQLDIDSDGYIVTVPGYTRTYVEGVFAAGDVRDQEKHYRQAVTAAAGGCMAALEADRFLATV